jgi:hypothetical protein
VLLGHVVRQAFGAVPWRALGAKHVRQPFTVPSEHVRQVVLQGLHTVSSFQVPAGHVVRQAFGAVP